MKKYYEILEVNPKASQEIIEKAYKVLAKKYHPDLQEEQHKELAKQKMQEINEAYEILSDANKSAQYDQQLANEEQRELQRKIEEQNKVYEQSQNIQQNQMQQDAYYQEQLRKEYERVAREQQRMQQKINEQQQNAYYNYLRSLGYKIKEKWTWKKTLNLFLVMGILIVIIAVLWVIPPTREWLISIYEGNVVIKLIVDLIVNIVTVLYNAIVGLFEHPPTI